MLKKVVHNPKTSQEIYKKIGDDEIKVLGSVRNSLIFYDFLSSFDIHNKLKDGIDTRIGFNKSFLIKLI